jgi:hypothetical protein
MIWIFVRVNMIGGGKSLPIKAAVSEMRRILPGMGRNE